MKTKFEDVAHFYLGCKLAHIWALDSNYIELDLNRLKLGTKDFKPILRKIESISDDEKRELYFIVFGKTYPKENRITYHEGNNLVYARWVLMSGVERLGIEVNGDVWADSDLQKWKFNPSVVFRYFISNGFDVFDLIKNDEAFDKGNWITF